MHNKNISLKVLKFILAIIIFIAITADRNLLISYFLGNRTNVVITLLFVLAFLFRYITENIIIGSIKYKRFTKSLLIVLVFISIYFLIHNITFPTSIIPIKYSMLSFFIIVFITNEIDITSTINGFAVIGLFLSIAIILQQGLLMLFHGGSLSGFDILINSLDVNRYTIGFVAPYGLGLIEYDYFPFIDFNGIEYYRPSLFTHESKHASSILLLTLSTVLLSKFSLTPKKIMIWLHLIAILLIMAFTSFVVLIITLTMYFVYQKKIFPIYYVFAVILFPFFLPWLLELVLPLFSSGNNLIYLRLLGAVAISGTGLDSVPSLFSAGAYLGIQSDNDSLFYYIYGQYGLIAMVIVALFLYVLIKYINKQASLKHYSSMSRFTSILLVNIFVFYNLYVFSDFLNLFSVFIVLFLLHIVEKSKSRLLSTVSVEC